MDQGINFFDHADIYADGDSERIFGNAVKGIAREKMIVQTKCGMIDSGLNVNMQNDSGIGRDGSVLEYCRLKGITIQAWSAFQYGFFEGVFLGNEKFPELNRRIDSLAEKYHAADSAIVIAWILRHPIGIQALIGSVKKQRIEEICRACDVKMTREEWYSLYMAAGKKLP